MFQHPVLRCPESEGGAWASLPSAKLGERTYRGERGADGVSRVWIESQPGTGEMPERSELPLHFDVRAHSPTGFAWGYGGSGPAQLALALLVDALGEREKSEIAIRLDFDGRHIGVLNAESSLQNAFD